MAVAGTMAFGVCAVELWQRGSGGRIVLALLFVSWSFYMQVTVAGSAAILALLFHFGSKRHTASVTDRLVAYVWIFAVAVATIWQVRLLAYPWKFFAAAPVEYTNFEFVLAKGLAFPLCALAAYFAIVRPRMSSLVQGGAAALLLAVTLAIWDHRSPAQRQVEENRFPAGLTQLIAQRQGEVFWIDGSAEAWFVLGRPQWASFTQGGPIIFSDALAQEWRRRMQIVMDLGLADQKSFSPWSDPWNADLPRLSQGGVQRLCRRADAPAWIIAPLEHGTERPAGIEMTLWQLPEPLFKLTKGNGEYVWQQIDAYEVIPCASLAHA
jgi:hypothetical protein